MGSGDEVVAVGGGDGDGNEVPWAEVSGFHADEGVDVRGIGGGAGDPGARLLGVWGVHEDGGGATDLLLGIAEGDGLLGAHEFMPTLFFDVFGEVAVESIGGCTGFAGVGKSAEAFEGVVLDEAEELLEVVVGLSGEADDEGGAEDDAGPVLSDAFEEAEEVVGVSGSAHAFEDARDHMLEGEIEVGDDASGLGSDLQECIIEMFGEGVEESDPVEGCVELVELTEQLWQEWLSGAVGAVGGEVLGDEDEFAGAVEGEAAGFVEDLIDGDGA